MRAQRTIAGFIVLAVVLCGLVGGFGQSRKTEFPQTFEELIGLQDEAIEKLDVARMNLLCAKGLPGSENLDIEQCLSKLDEWAKHVAVQEQKYLPVFPRYREKYKNSLALFKGVYLGIAIQQDFKCGYNQDLIDSGAMDDRRSTRFFRDSSDIFINGLIEKGKGSCSSLPVLMVALGRRCNYPLYLVGCGGHAFVRWDGADERVNLEITNIGVNSHDDDYYRKWPRPISEKEILDERHLKNYTGKEMLGIFASLRAACLKEHQRYREAKECEEVALRSFPESRILKLCIKDIEDKLQKEAGK